MVSTHWRNPRELTETEVRSLDVLARLAADLMERARVEDALRRSEERLRQVAEIATWRRARRFVRGDTSRASSNFYAREP